VTEPPGEEDIAAATDAMMRRVMASRLSHRAALVDGVELNRWTQTRRQQEVEEGLAASMAALPESERLGFTAFAVGNSALPEDDDSDKAQTDIGRAQFTQAFADDADDGGAGVTYRLDETTSVGIAITSYSDTSSSESGDIASSSYLASTLRGGLSYTHGLRQDDYEVEVEQAGLGSQQETIDRPTIQTVGLTLGGTLGLSEALAVDAGVLLQHDLEAGASQSARVGVSWRF
jgi:hypothetical protein